MNLKVKAIAAGLLAGLVVVGGIAAGAQQVAAPRACKAQLNGQVDRMLVSDAPIEDWKPSPSALWTCLLLTKDQRELIALDVMTERGPEVFLKAMRQAFE